MIKSGQVSTIFLASDRLILAPDKILSDLDARAVGSWLSLVAGSRAQRKPAGD